MIVKQADSLPVEITKEEIDILIKAVKTLKDINNTLALAGCPYMYDKNGRFICSEENIADIIACLDYFVQYPPTEISAG